MKVLELSGWRSGGHGNFKDVSSSLQGEGSWRNIKEKIKDLLLELSEGWFLPVNDPSVFSLGGEPFKLAGSWRNPTDVSER